MDTRKIAAGILSSSALVMGGVDAAVLNEVPFERVETVAEYTIEAKQIGNKVETTFPWKDQEGFKVSYDLGEPTLTERVVDKRKKEVITELVAVGDGGFKVDILLHEKPDTNKFCYAIEGAENYNFFYQPPLTEERIKQGYFRPENVVGSYAVYHKELKDHVLGNENYATGKVMHIYRPQVWELNNENQTKEWAELSYNDKEGLCVTARQEFLENATYPVRIDPTFGYTRIGATNGVYGANFAYGYAATARHGTGTIDKITVHWRNVTSTSSSNVKFFLTDSSRILVTNGVTNAGSPTSTTYSWNDIVFSTPPSITNNTGYYIYHIHETGSLVNIPQDDTGAFSSLGSFDNTNSYASPQSTNSGSDGDSFYSMYATYSASTCNPYIEKCTEYFTGPLSYTWTAPTDVNSADVACWGAGGGGDVIATSAGGGGGGGAFASSTVALTPGANYTVTIGVGGTSGTTPTAGGDSTFVGNDKTVLAAGGRQAVNTVGGAGGSTASSTGDVEFAGGNGGAGQNSGDVGGGGGGSAGPHGAGGNGALGEFGVGGGGGGGNGGSNGSGSTGGSSTNGGAGGNGDINGPTDPFGGFGVSNILGGGGGGGGDDGDPGGFGGHPGGGGGGGEVVGMAHGADGQCSITYTASIGGGGGATSTPQTEFWFD